MDFAELSEFIIYKLKEMEKITQEDITLVMNEFEELEVDQSGTLPVSDFNTCSILNNYLSVELMTDIGIKTS